MLFGNVVAPPANSELVLAARQSSAHPDTLLCPPRTHCGIHRRRSQRAALRHVRSVLEAIAELYALGPPSPKARADSSRDRPGQSLALHCFGELQHSWYRHSLKASLWSRQSSDSESIRNQVGFPIPIFGARRTVPDRASNSSARRLGAVLPLPGATGDLRRTSAIDGLGEGSR